jgi:hypothetical protein
MYCAYGDDQRRRDLLFGREVRDWIPRVAAPPDISTSRAGAPVWFRADPCGNSGIAAAIIYIYQVHKRRF